MLSKDLKLFSGGFYQVLNMHFSQFHSCAKEFVLIYMTTLIHGLELHQKPIRPLLVKILKLILLFK